MFEVSKNYNSKKNKPKNITMDEIQLYLMCSLPMLFVFVFSYLPMGGIIIAFKKYRFDTGIFGSEWVGLKNFEYFLKSNEFLKLTRNTIGLNFLFIVAGTIAAIAVALLMFHLRKKILIKTIKTMLITPYFVSWVIASYMCYTFLNPNYGIVNSFLSLLGIGTVDWYSTPNAWIYILTITFVWKSVGVDSIIYYAILMGIDDSLFEAATIDGASRWRKVKSIMLPELVPILVILTILKIGSICRADFGLFYQLTRDVGALYDVTDVIDTYVFRTMRVIGDVGSSSAVGLLQSAVGFILVMFTNYVAKKIDSNYGLF